MAALDARRWRESCFLGLSSSCVGRFCCVPADDVPVPFQIDEDPSLVPEAIQGGTFGFNSSANVPAEGFQF